MPRPHASRIPKLASEFKRRLSHFRYDLFAPSRRRARLPPILPLVLYHGRAPWAVPTTILDCLDADPAVKEEVRDPRYHVRDLSRLVPDVPSGDDPTWAVLRALATVGRDGQASIEVLAGIVAALPDGSLLERQVVRYIVCAILFTWHAP